MSWGAQGLGRPLPWCVGHKGGQRGALLLSQLSAPAVSRSAASALGAAWSACGVCTVGSARHRSAALWRECRERARAGWGVFYRFQGGPRARQLGSPGRRGEKPRDRGGSRGHGGFFVQTLGTLLQIRLSCCLRLRGERIYVLCSRLGHRGQAAWSGGWLPLSHPTGHTSPGPGRGSSL